MTESKPVGKSNPMQSQRSCVSLLGRLLGEVIKKSHGEKGFNTVETLRVMAKQSRENNHKVGQQDLQAAIANLESENTLLAARAFTQFLNLANIAEQFYSHPGLSDSENSANDLIATQIKTFKQQGIDKDRLLHEIQHLHLDLVLTAHPTEITRRTLIEKQNKIYNCLYELDSRRLNDQQKAQHLQRLTDLIAQWWHTDEMREQKPTPVDEAVWGFAVIENSLWEAVPQFTDQLTESIAQEYGVKLPIEFMPIQFTSWMGGDRDGNPNVTSNITQEVIWLARWKAADLFLKDVHQLMSELSMNQCSAQLREQAGDVREPYRAILKELRTLLINTLESMDNLIKGRDNKAATILQSTEQLWQPLHDCYISLCECGMENIANGKLRDTLRRVRCFGAYLLRLDVRQESTRHKQVFIELTKALNEGDANNHYENWSEQQRCEFLTKELTNKRPLLPRRWQPSADVQEVLNTFATLSQQPSEALGAYVISMAKAASDVLAVQLLLKEFSCPNIPIAPLFETLDDLNNAPGIMQQLLSNSAYRDVIDNKQMIMIGYSDSAKDAGVMAASWAQYRAQESLLQVCEQAGVELTLFHGRGGTTGRGGAPAHAALLSQPPGTLKNGLRVTEQGEMIRFKLGTPDKAVNTFELYTSAMLQSNITPPPQPQDQWREVMDELSAISAQAYRQKVFHQESFLHYFKTATPIAELSTLPLGSRPARRKTKDNDGVESLRAIPWSFAWSQNRLMFPAWYGAGEALQKLVDQGQQPILETMCRQWPFFSTRISLLEMVYAKTDADISACYEKRLSPSDLHPLGAELRKRLHDDIALVLSIANDKSLLQDLPALVESLLLRNTYIDPLNLLQVELLSRNRDSANKNPQTQQQLEKALMVTVAGIAAGLRNTG